jgi:hypothetical protein
MSIIEEEEEEEKDLYEVPLSRLAKMNLPEWPYYIVGFIGIYHHLR